MTYRSKPISYSSLYSLEESVRRIQKAMVIPQLGLSMKLDGQPGICGEVTKEHASILYFQTGQRTGNSRFYGKFQEINGKVYLVGNFEKTFVGIVGTVFTSAAILFALLFAFFLLTLLDFHERADIGFALFFLVIFSHLFLFIWMGMKMHEVNRTLIDHELRRILCS